MTSRRALRPRERTTELCMTLPQVEMRDGQHIAFSVRGKKFAYYLDDHHGDGRLALNCRAAPGVNEALIASAPDRFFMPPYVGPRGWVGLYLDRPRVDWEEVRELVTDAYSLAAPKRLVAELDAASTSAPKRITKALK
jgi:phosphoribosylglycinamide formyltransferase-1